MSSELGKYKTVRTRCRANAGHKTVRTRFRCWLAGKSPYTLFSCVATSLGSGAQMMGPPLALSGDTIPCRMTGANLNSHVHYKETWAQAGLQ